MYYSGSQLVRHYWHSTPVDGAVGFTLLNLIDGAADVGRLGWARTFTP